MITRYPLAERLAGDITVGDGQDHADVFVAAYSVLTSREPTAGELDAAMAVMAPPPVPTLHLASGPVPGLLRWE